MITEADVIKILPKNNESWLTSYIGYCAEQTTSPLAYHLGMGLTLLAVSAPHQLTMRYFGKLPANIFCMLAGRSGEDQKSTALGLGYEILDMVDHKLIGDQPASAEGLIDSLAAQNQFVLMYSEFGQFLAQAKNGYFESIKATMTNLWDGKNVSRRKAGDVVIRAENPRLSIAAACSIPYIAEYTRPHDWSGGFMGRWLLMYAKRERTMAFPPPETDEQIQMRKWLVQDLAKRRNFDGEHLGRCIGLDEESRKIWEKWYFELQDRSCPELIAGTKTRLPAIAMRVAFLYAWDQCTAIEHSSYWIIPQAIQFGIAVAELHYKSVVSLALNLVEHPDAQQRKNILKCFSNDPDQTLGSILKKTKLKKRTVTDIIDGLLIEGTLDEIETLNNGNRLFRLNETY